MGFLNLWEIFSVPSKAEKEPKAVGVQASAASGKPRLLPHGRLVCGISHYRPKNQPPPCCRQSATFESVGTSRKEALAKKITLEETQAQDLHPLAQKIVALLPDHETLTLS